VYVSLLFIALERTLLVLFQVLDKLAY